MAADYCNSLFHSRFHLLSLRNNPEKNKRDLVFVLLFHTVVAAAIALSATGASGLQSTKDQADPTKLNTDWHLAGIGGVILISAITLVFLGAVYTYLCYRPSSSKDNNTTPQQQQQQRLAQTLVVAVILACPLVAIRMIGSAAFYFSENLDMSPLSGTWGFRVGLYLVPELLAACALLAGGLVARNVGESRGLYK